MWNANIAGARYQRYVPRLAACLVAGTLASVVSATPAVAGPGDITTIAHLPDPWGLTRVGSERYVSQEHPNRVSTVVNGTVTLFAGGGSAPLGDRAKATNATLGGPEGVAFDAAGNLYIADTATSRVRRVDAVTRTITTVAGNGTFGFSGDGGPATSAQLNRASRVAVDAFGNLFISDTANFRVRRVDAVAHTITTVVGTGNAASSGDNGPATAAGLSSRGVAFDGAGNLYVADVSGARIRQVVPGSDGVVNGGRGEIITTYVGGGTLLLGPTNEGKPALQFSLTGSQAFPQGIAFDAADNLYVALVGSPRVIEVAAAGAHALTTVAGDGTQAGTGATGDGGPATSARLTFPYGVTVDPAGNVFIADLHASSSSIRRVDAATQIITTVIGLGQNADFGAFGGYGDGGPAAAVPVGEPTDVAFRGGSLFFVDRQTDRARRIDARGIVVAHCCSPTGATAGSVGSRRGRRHRRQPAGVAPCSPRTPLSPPTWVPVRPTV